MGKGLRKRLTAQKWLDLMRQDSNPTQTWKRMQSQIQQAIDDLVLLADSLPDDKQEQMFNYENINRLISSMLRQPFWIDSNHDELDGRRTQLAALLARMGLNKCINQYTTIVEKDVTLSAANVSLLQNAINLSNQIALKIQVQESELKTKNGNLVYLFNWSNVSNTDSNRLRKFLKKEFDLEEWIKSATIKKTEDDKTISLSLKEDNNNNNNLTSISIKLNDNKTNATLSIYDKTGNEQHNKKLIVMDENGTLNVYTKKTKTYKSKGRNRLKDYNTVPAS